MAKKIAGSTAKPKNTLPTTKKSAAPKPADPTAQPAPAPDSAAADSAAADSGQQIDPPDSARSFPIVGIGASAGGLAAFEAFFSGMPKDRLPGMAFVLVQHLAPDHKSMLAALIGRYTPMPVFEVTDAMTVQINCVYIIAPNHDMALVNGSLQLLDPSAPRGQRLPIDFFFKSLAADLRQRAIGIVLSGSGHDASVGVGAIKDAGGMVIAQTPQSADFDGMPRSALATGLVDYELDASQMAAQLLTYVKHAIDKFSPRADKPLLLSESALRKMAVLLRQQTGHDFSQYKPGTIQRRIERRMAVHQIEQIDDYINHLQQYPQEVEALFRDLLIGVTNFFRDPEAFATLETQAIPLLFANKPKVGGVVRVWVAGCSTGEEAYSIAILLQEYMEAVKQSYSVQLFATDIDSRAISYARAGRYPLSIAADITPLRLARFFTPEPDGSGYRIHRGIRDMLVFSEQDLIKDPPFSKLDLLSCRNLMIYLGASLQGRLIPLFHCALNSDGLLFLGSSEGVGDFLSLFGTLDRKAKIYQRKGTELGAMRSPNRFLPQLSALQAALPRGPGRDAFPIKLPLRELTEQALLAQLAPVAALVNTAGDIFYLQGRTGMYLEPTPGEVTVANVVKMAREGLRPALSNALQRATTTQVPEHVRGLQVRTNSHFTRVNLSVCPVSTSHLVQHHTANMPLQQPGTPVNAPLYLVVFEQSQDLPPDALANPASASGSAESAMPLAADSEADTQIAALREELRAKDEYLQSTYEALESSNEELKSSNEEMQSVNEELQSTNEELETSKEELQSVNEELSTVNNELHTKLDDLSRLNNDMNNLLAGTGVATVFVDHQLRILRFTPTASLLINLIATDIGRPVGHILSNLVGYTSLVADTQAVLDTLQPKDVQVQTTNGAWFVLRIRPYRTLGNVIEGAVVTFSDISELKRAEAALALANHSARLAVVVHDAFDAITMIDLEGRTLAWNPAAERLYGWTEAQALQLTLQDRVPPDLQHESVARLHQLSTGQTLGLHPTRRLTQSGQVLDIELLATALVNDKGLVYAVATTERIRTTTSPPTK